MSELSFNIRIGICIGNFKKAVDDAARYKCLDDANIILENIISSMSEKSNDLKKINSLLFILIPSMSLDNLNDLWSKISLIKLNEATYTIFIKRFADLVQKESAMGLLSLMIDSNIQPHYRTYIHIISMLCLNNCPFEVSIDEIMYVYNLILNSGYMDCELYEIILRNKLVKIEIGAEIFIKDIAKFEIYPLSQNLILIIRGLCSGNVSTCLTRNYNDFLCPNCSNILTPYYDHEVFQSIQYDIIKNTPKSKLKDIEQFKNYIQKTNYDIILDAGNIAFYKNRTQCQTLNICKMYNYLTLNGFNPLIIISKARFNGVDVDRFKNLQKWVTPRGVNDDIYWLYAVVQKPGVKVLTNDEIKDHNLQDYLDVQTKMKLKNNCWIRYDMNRNGQNIKLLDIPTCAKRIHYDEHTIHIPTESNQFICSTLIV